jgi:hypothetical protein
MNTLRTFWLLLLLISDCRADEPIAKITAPEKAQVGFPVLLETGGSVGNAMKWIAFPSDPSSVFLPVVTEDGQRVGLFVSARPGIYYFALVAASGDKIAVARHTLVVEQGQPDPGPSPTPNPAPDPVPPVPTGKLWTVMVEESSQLTPAQGRVVTSKAVADWIAAGGHHRAWVIDKDTVDENDRQPASLREYIARAKSLPYLFLVSESGIVVHEGPLPDSDTAFLELLKRYGAAGPARRSENNGEVGPACRTGHCCGK